MKKIDCAILLLHLLVRENGATTGQLEAVARAIMALGKSEENE